MSAKTANTQYGEPITDFCNIARQSEVHLRQALTIEDLELVKDLLRQELTTRQRLAVHATLLLAFVVGLNALM